MPRQAKWLLTIANSITRRTTMAARDRKGGYGMLVLLSMAMLLLWPLPGIGADEPARPGAHFHHLHLNSVDPKTAIDFYPSKFDCEKAQFAGVQPAVWTQKSWLLFHKVKTPPPWEFTSAIWHFGWGAEDMKAAYQKQLDMKTKFFTPISPIG